MARREHDADEAEPAERQLLLEADERPHDARADGRHDAAADEDDVVEHDRREDGEDGRVARGDLGPEPGLARVPDAVDVDGLPAARLLGARRGSSATRPKTSRRRT